MGLCLMDVLAALPDPPETTRPRHPLPAILALAVVAILAGHRSLEAIARFGRDHGPPWLTPWAFAAARPPSKERSASASAVWTSPPSRRPCAGKVVTGDALFTHRDFAQGVRDGGGDYLLIVKENQPPLQAQSAATLDDDAAFSPLPTQAEGGRRAGRPDGG
jgi:hypothetical protein